MSCKESACEKNFVQNFQKDINGRYIVRLSFRENHAILGDSYDLAYKRLLAMESKLNKDPALKCDYFKGMQ